MCIYIYIHIYRERGGSCFAGPERQLVALLPDGPQRPESRLHLSIYLSIYLSLSLYIYMHIYIYIERERDVILVSLTFFIYMCIYIYTYI